MPADPNKLLYVITARRRMTWSDYREAVDLLMMEGIDRTRFDHGTETRSGLLQCLEALGHCDVYYDQGQCTIVATPPSLCRLPRAGLPVAVLTGARSSKTKDQLVEAADAQKSAIQIRTECHPGPLGLIPDTVLIEAASEDVLATLAASLGLRYPDIPPAWTLVNWCGTLTEYESILDYRIPAIFNWIRYDFCVASCTFQRTHSDSFPRLSMYRNPATTLPMHVFFRNDTGAEVDLNWGRYLLLNANGTTVTAYDEKSYRLCIPLRIPLPTVIARSVCLCSGRPPVHRSAVALVPGCDYRDWLMFEDVPPQIAIAALSKVGQTPEKLLIR